MSTGVVPKIFFASVCVLAAANASSGGFWDACKRAGTEIANWNEVKIVNQENVPYALKEGISPEKVIRQAIAEWAESLRGSATVSESGTGKLSCVLKIRKHTATVLISYDTTKFSIVYQSSVALNYNAENQTIHPNYNIWTKQLAEKIISCAAAGREVHEEEVAASAKAGVSAAAASVEGENAGDVKSRLKKLKELKDDGLISDEEYQEKRKSILKSL